MTRLQDDILAFYNEMTEFSKMTLENNVPIKITYNKNLGSLKFDQRGRTLNVGILNYYCGELNALNTYMLPSEYNEMMTTLASLIASGSLIRERILVSPEKYGFSIYEAKVPFIENGPERQFTVKIANRNSWLFRAIVKHIYKQVL